MNTGSSGGGGFSMLKYEGGPDAGGGGLGGWPRECDSCRAAPSAVYCRADAAYLCAGCDARLHHANRVASRHERVWVCEACERAPATLTCRADAAALCAACDVAVHSANPLARRHHRVPILPLPAGGSLPGPGLPGPFLGAEPPAEEEVAEDDGEDEATSWLLMNKNCNQSSYGALFGGEVDEYLDLVWYNNCNEIQNQEQQHQNFGKNESSVCVVPSHCVAASEQQQQRCGVDMEHEVSNARITHTASLSHSVSFTSMDVSIVPDTTMTDISNSHFLTPKGSIDLFSGPPLQTPSQFPMDREAKVLRYREKRKTRKFEKTIRYASRKAYAETRPRIKGRFAKRLDVEQEMDQMFSTSVPSEGSYGIVPSF